MELKFGNYTFDVPPDFELCEKASKTVDGSPNPLNPDFSPTVITLTSTIEVFSDELVYLLRPNGFEPEDFPISISINNVPSESAACPLEHLRSMAYGFQDQFNGFKSRYCHWNRVGDSPAARGQFHFIANFRMELLILVWTLGEDLFSAKMLVPFSGAQKSWKALFHVAHSIKCSSNYSPPQIQQKTFSHSFSTSYEKKFGRPATLSLGFD